jgi:hypothetical protein
MAHTVLCDRFAVPNCWQREKFTERNSGEQKQFGNKELGEERVMAAVRGELPVAAAVREDAKPRDKGSPDFGASLTAFIGNSHQTKLFLCTGR